MPDETEDPGVSVTLAMEDDWGSLDFSLNVPNGENDGTDALYRPGRVALAPTTVVPAGSAVHVPFPDRSMFVVIQNRTAGPITRQYGGTAGAGSFQIAAGATVVDNYRTTDVSIWSPLAATINDAATGDIVIELGL